MACSHCGRCHEQGKSVLKVSDALKQKRPWVLASLARVCGISEMQAARDLPDEMRTFAPGHAFEKVWHGLCQWNHAVFVAQQGGFGVKYSGRIPEGRSVNGIYHFAGDGLLGGHVRLDSVSGICFLSLPFMGRASCSIQFFDQEGSVMFAIHVGRKDGQLSPHELASFQAMRQEAEQNYCPAKAVFEIPLYQAV